MTHRLQKSKSSACAPEPVAGSDIGASDAPLSPANPAHQLRRELARRFGCREFLVRLPSESKLAVNLDLAAAAISRAAGPLLLASALLGLGWLIF